MGVQVAASDQWVPKPRTVIPGVTPLVLPRTRRRRARRSGFRRLLLPVVKAGLVAAAAVAGVAAANALPI